MMCEMLVYYFRMVLGTAVFAWSTKIRKICGVIVSVLRKVREDPG